MSSATMSGLKAEFEREAMLNAWNQVVGVVPKKSPKPVLQNVLLTVKYDGTATLQATDLEIAVTVTVLGCSAAKEGEVLLSDRFGQILSSADEKNLRLYVSENKLTVKGETSTFNMTIEDPELFPQVVTEFEEESYFEMESEAFRRGIARTHYATDPGSTRYALAGVLFTIKENLIQFVGTDGRRLACQDLPVVRSGEMDDEISGVVPVKAIKTLLKVVQDDDPPVHFAFRKMSAIVIRTDRSTIYSRLVEGRFPRFNDVFPKDDNQTTILTRSHVMSSALARASIATTNESKGVSLYIDPQNKNLQIKAVSPNIGDADVNMPIAGKGKSLEISFDPRYVRDGLSCLPVDTEVTVGFHDEKTAGIITTNDGYRYVIMPLTLDK